jgi:hypothetical protein
MHGVRFRNGFAGCSCITRSSHRARLLFSYPPSKSYFSHITDMITYARWPCRLVCGYRSSPKTGDYSGFTIGQIVLTGSDPIRWAVPAEKFISRRSPQVFLLVPHLLPCIITSQPLLQRGWYFYVLRPGLHPIHYRTFACLLCRSVCLDCAYSDQAGQADEGGPSRETTTANQED